MVRPIFLLAPALALLVPSALYALALTRHRSDWHRERLDNQDIPLGIGAFRRGSAAAPVVTVTQDGPPWNVRVAAYTCFFMGQMVVPAVPVWLLGVFIALAGHPGNGEVVLTALLAAGPPGAWAAIETFRCGSALLSGDRLRAAAQVGRSVSVTVVLNALMVLVACTLLMARTGDADALEPCLVYMLVSIVHAVFVWVTYHRAAPAYREGPVPQD